MYSKHWTLFTHFLTHILKQDIHLPVSPSIIPLFIAHLHKIPYRHSTILTYMSAISYVHKLQGLPDPTSTFLVSKVLLGVKNSTSPPDRLLPITKPLLHRIIQYIPYVTQDHYLRTMYKATFLLMYYACLRVGEVSKSSHTDNILLLNQVTPNISSSHVLTCPPSSYSIAFTSYKHSQGKTPTLSLSQTPNKLYCPVHALFLYLRKRPNRTPYLFVDRDGCVITRNQIVALLKSCLQKASIPSHNISSHSFRVGRTTDLAFVHHHSDSQIQALGRWKSSAYKLYIRPPVISLPV